MSNQNILNLEEFISNFKIEVATAEQIISQMNALNSNKDSLLVQSMFCGDSTFEYHLKHTNKFGELLLERITHFAWKNYFNASDLFKRLSNEDYYSAIKPYTLANVKDNSRHNNKEKLIEFTLENIELFEKQFKTVDVEKLTKEIQNFVFYFGVKDFATAYKTRQTLRDSKRPNGFLKSEKIEMIAKVVQAIEYFKGVESSPTVVGDIKQKLFDFKGSEIEIIDGLLLVCKEDSSNTEIKLSKELVALLNSKL